MLYKNLPDSELNSVLRVRKCLDILAALVFFLKGERGNARAVFQARNEFKKMVGLYESVREENMRQTVVKSIGQRTSYSILWKFHVCGKKIFTQL